MHSVADEILYVISTKREVAWELFKSSLDELYARSSVSEIPDAHEVHIAGQKLKRTLEAAGHCEFRFARSGSRVYVAPAVLALLPTWATAEGVLCGARTAKTVAKVIEVANQLDQKCEVDVREANHATNYCPTRIVVRAPSLASLRNLASKLGIGFSETPQAWSFACLAPSVQDLANKLAWQPGDEPNWPLQDFDPRSLSFRARRGRSAEPIRLTSYRNPKTGQNQTLAWENARFAPIDRDWGRFWILNRLSIPALKYDPAVRTVTLPSSLPLPSLFAKALTLCSGDPPANAVATVGSPSFGTDYSLVYSRVPISVAERVLEKLGQ